MKKESFQGILLGIVIMCAVFAFITVAWAAFSSTLTIGGTATVAAQNWKVEFSDTSTAVLAGSAATVTAYDAAGSATTSAVLPGSAPTLSTSAFATGTESLAKFENPGEKIVYEWHIVNDGTFDAKLKSITNILTGASTIGSNVKLACTSTDAFGRSGGVANVDAWCGKYVKAELQVNGVVVTTDASGNLSSTATTVVKKSGATLGTVPVKLTLQYVNDPAMPTVDLPTADVTIAVTSGIVMTFEQA